MENNFSRVKTMQHVPVYFEQDLVFSFYQEKLNERGKKMSKEISREISMDYVDFVDGLHKYQICCSACDIHMNRWINLTSDVFMELDSIFSLLVVSADEKGNVVELHNFPYLQYEWNEMKEQLLTEYDEQAVERFGLIKEMDIRMQDYNRVLNYLKSPEMYGLFFNGYWQKIDSQHVRYGEELNNIFFEEEIKGSIKEKATDQFVSLHITGKSPDMDESTVQYTGSCTFINGALNNCEKNICIDQHNHFNYSMRWIGLKQRL